MIEVLFCNLNSLVYFSSIEHVTLKFAYVMVEASIRYEWITFFQCETFMSDTLSACLQHHLPFSAAPDSAAYLPVDLWETLLAKMNYNHLNLLNR